MYCFNTSYPKQAFLAELNHLVKFWDGLVKAVDEHCSQGTPGFFFSLGILVGMTEEVLPSLHSASEECRPCCLLPSRADELMFR